MSFLVFHRYQQCCIYCTIYLFIIFYLTSCDVLILINNKKNLVLTTQREWFRYEFYPLDFCLDINYVQVYFDKCRNIVIHALNSPAHVYMFISFVLSVQDYYVPPTRIFTLHPHKSNSHCTYDQNNNPTIHIET